MSSFLSATRPFASNLIKSSTSKLNAQQASFGRDAQHRPVFLRSTQDRLIYGIATSFATVGVIGLGFGASRLTRGLGKSEQ